MKTDNPFAILLVFYDCYLSYKLNNDDLGKIKSKYEKKPQKLLQDLQKKYADLLPPSVSSNQLIRCIHKYEISRAYVNLLQPFLPTDLNYEPTLDVCSSQFDPEAAFGQRRIFAADTNISPVDNMSKAQHLLPGAEPPTVIDRSQVIAKRKAVASSVVPTSQDNRHFFDTLAEASLPSYSFRDDLGVENVLPSPAALLFQFMKKKERVRIILRRQGGVRGSMDAYIQGFDKYFNVYLVDIDEEYLRNKVIDSMLSRRFS